MEKSVSYQYAKDFAKKHGIKCFDEVNHWTKKLTTVFYGTANEFFDFVDKDIFAQVTEPYGFGRHTKGETNIEVMIPTGKNTGTHYCMKFIVNKGIRFDS